VICLIGSSASVLKARFLNSTGLRIGNPVYYQKMVEENISVNKPGF
jgi:hypothetical protein